MVNWEPGTLKCIAHIQIQMCVCSQRAVCTLHAEAERTQLVRNFLFYYFCVAMKPATFDILENFPRTFLPLWKSYFNCSIFWSARESQNMQTNERISYWRNYCARFNHFPGRIALVLLRAGAYYYYYYLSIQSTKSSFAKQFSIRAFWRRS